MIDTVFNILKVSAVVAISAVFMVAIQSLIGFIQIVVFHNVIGEVFGLMSMYLPFDAAAVFGSIGTATIAILSFLIAKKIFDLTSWSISSI